MGFHAVVPTRKDLSVEALTRKPADQHKCPSPPPRLLNPTALLF